jgi:hypothetical protein
MYERVFFFFCRKQLYKVDDTVGLRPCLFRLVAFPYPPLLLAAVTYLLEARCLTSKALLQMQKAGQYLDDLLLVSTFHSLGKWLSKEG